MPWSLQYTLHQLTHSISDGLSHCSHCSAVGQSHCVAHINTNSVPNSAAHVLTDKDSNGGAKLYSDCQAYVGPVVCAFCNTDGQSDVCVQWGSG